MCGSMRIAVRGSEKQICEAVCVTPMCEGGGRELEIKRPRGRFGLIRGSVCFGFWVGVSLKPSGAHMIPSKLQTPDMELLFVVCIPGFWF